ncbi:glycosyltransferase family 4 protein [Shewanella indica]|uniref:glycosyltransferase family 4 protein n=1 Tax=Shewanella indica TaxID=768528 RepID=UPI00313C15C5
MKIVHICLSCFYIDGYSYQENELVKQHVAQNHDVLVIASTENYVDAKLTYVTPGQYQGKDGANVIRIPYISWLPHKVATKLRIHSGLYSLLISFSPDVIVFHGLCGWELRTVCSYKKNNPSVRLWVDSHEDHNNSARTFGSRLLHKIYYRTIIRSVEEVLQKVLCVSLDTMTFVEEMYGISKEKLEFYPLGAKVYTDDEYVFIREEARKELQVNDNNIVFVQSGKQTVRKKLIESLTAFNQILDDNFRFLIVGSLAKDIEREALQLINKDPRVIYLGWKTSEQLSSILCAADVYVQPGTQSATMQMALGARCAIILDNVISHKPYANDTGWLISHSSELKDIFKKISIKQDVSNEKVSSGLFATQSLDYRKLAERLFHD